MQGKIEIRDTFEGQQEQLMEVITMLFHPVKMIAMTKTIQTIPVMKKIWLHLILILEDNKNPISILGH